MGVNNPSQDHSRSFHGVWRGAEICWFRQGLERAGEEKANITETNLKNKKITKKKRRKMIK